MRVLHRWELRCYFRGTDVSLTVATIQYMQEICRIGQNFLHFLIHLHEMLSYPLQLVMCRKYEEMTRELLKIMKLRSYQITK